MTIDVLESLNAELDECAALLRPHYPDENDEQLRARAMYWRPKRHETGRWPSSQEIEEYKAEKAAEKAPAEKPAAAKAAAEQAAYVPA
jgi:hypothetical protein